MNIATCVRGCLDGFAALADSDAASGDVEAKARIANEASRFKVWAGNLSAHRPFGRRSLEYRLRDSHNLRIKVLDLLKDLIQALDRLQDTERHTEEEKEEVDTDDSLPDFEYDDLAMQPSDAIQDVHDTITLMYHFSIALRNPAGHNRIREGYSSSACYFTPKDIEHVSSKYPHADQYLVERLAKAMSSRRQYNRYRVCHHAKLSAGLENETDEMPSTIASSHNNKLQHVVLDDDDAASVSSMNSFAPTESETGRLRPPPLPEAGQEGEPFECPICFGMQVFPNDSSWQKHVLEDITPYMCIIQGCRSQNQQFARRKDWQHHHTTAHNSLYACPMGCEKTYDSTTDVEGHLIKVHDFRKDDATLHRISERAARPSEDPQILSCPLCKKESLPPNLHFRHVGKHMEQLAFWTLPSDLLTAESDDEVSNASDYEKGVNYSHDAESPLSDELEARSGDEATASTPPMTLPILSRQGSTGISISGSASSEHHRSSFSTAARNYAASIAEKFGSYGSSPPMRRLGNSPGELPHEAPVLRETDDRPVGGLDAEFSDITLVSPSGTSFDTQEEEDSLEKFKTKQKAAKEEEEEEYQDFLREQEARAEKRREEEQEADEEFQAVMRERLQNLGYTKETIDIMVDEEKEKAEELEKDVERRKGDELEYLKAPRAPVYPKVHRKYLSVETLKYYDLPWEVDRSNADYLIILRELDKRETDLLFEHTARLRAEKVFLGRPDKPPKLALARRRSTSRGESEGSGTQRLE